MSAAMDPLPCAPSTSTTAGFIVHPNGHSHVGTINLKIYEAPKPPIRLPKSIESNVQDPNKSFIGREEVLELVDKAIGDRKSTDKVTVPGLKTSEPKKIGCWTARTWTLVVACLSIVSSVLVGVICSIHLADLKERESQDKLINGENVERVTIALAVTVAAQTADFFMAFLLIFGVNLRSSGAVLSWLCWAFVAAILTAGFYLADENTPIKIIAAVIVLCVKLILISTVHTHWKEIRGSSGQNVVADNQDGV